MPMAGRVAIGLVWREVRDVESEDGTPHAFKRRQVVALAAGDALLLSAIVAVVADRSKGGGTYRVLMDAACCNYAEGVDESVLAVSPPDWASPRIQSRNARTLQRWKWRGGATRL
jgi:hypothetical protein